MSKLATEDETAREGGKTSEKERTDLPREGLQVPWTKPHGTFDAKQQEALAQQSMESRNHILISDHPQIFKTL